MAHSDATREKPYKNYAWLLLLSNAVVMLFIGLGSLTAVSAREEFNVPGMTWQQLVSDSPLVARWIQTSYRSSGIVLLGFASYAVVVTAIPYRKGERWAWYLSWLLPLAYIGQAIVSASSDLSLGQSLDLTPIFVLGVGFPVLGFLGLLLPIRKFFPKRRTS
jgi:hypothetical protein